METDLHDKVKEKRTVLPKVYKTFIAFEWLFLSLLAGLEESRGSTTYYSLDDGEWGTSIWSTASFGGDNCGCDPGSNFNKTANIANSITVSNYTHFKMSGGGEINIQGGKLVINSDFDMSGGSTMNIANGDSVIINGDLTVSGNSNVDVSGYFLVNGNAKLSGQSAVCGTGTAVLNGTLTGSTWCGSILPVKLLDFKVNQEEGRAIINWSTATETNNDYFTVERSTDGSNFTAILNVPGAGNSNTILYYSAIDDSPVQGTSYYRLRQVDYDGNSECSFSLAFSFNTVNQFELLSSGPNPFNDNINLYYTLDRKQDLEIQIINLKGEIVYTQNIQGNAGKNLLTCIDVRKYNPGMYNIKIISNSDIISKSMVKN